MLWYLFSFIRAYWWCRIESNPLNPICQWNLNSMLAHNYSKISLLTVYISIHHFDIIFLSETYLTSTTDINNENLKIPGYIIYRVDHPSNVKKGRVCILYKIMLPLKVLSTNFLQECLNFEVTIRNKKCQFIHLYRTPMNLTMPISGWISWLSDKLRNESGWLV